MRDRVGRGLAAVCAVLSLGAFANGVLLVVAADDDRLVVEAWRTAGFLVFAGLWALVAARPRGVPGAWELLLLHKLAITVFAFAVGDVPEARGVAAVDLGLLLATAAAYVLCRGWTAWSVPTVPAARRDRAGVAS